MTTATRFGISHAITQCPTQGQNVRSPPIGILEQWIIPAGADVGFYEAAIAPQPSNLDGEKGFGSFRRTEKMITAIIGESRVSPR